eukprot:1159085-Pelagomonas_calceolata.AAC.7
MSAKSHAPAQLCPQKYWSKKMHTCRGGYLSMCQYAPSLHLKYAHPQPLHLIGTSFALKYARHYKLPEHMLREVKEKPLCYSEYSELSGCVGARNLVHWVGALLDWPDYNMKEYEGGRAQYRMPFCATSSPSLAPLQVAAYGAL